MSRTAASLLLWSAAGVYCLRTFPVRHTSSVSRIGWPIRCTDEGELPASATSAIPATELAGAWRRDEKAQELADALKGCPLYLVGYGSRRKSLGRVLSRRLPRYRDFDVPTLIVSTYNSIAGDEKPCNSTGQLCQQEPIEDVAQINRLVVDQVQGYTRAVITAWEGGITPGDFRIMQQGIVLHINEDVDEELSAMPAEIIEQWRAGYDAADVAFSLSTDVPLDDAVFQLMQDVLQFIQDNPGKSADWKAKADAAQRPEGAPEA